MVNGKHMENGEPKTVNGILLFDKPAGWTSHDVVAKVRRLASQAAGKKVKVGHSGTLDPAATGLLLLLLGSYTKKAGDFAKLDKTYEAEMTLGKVSTTGDSEGEIQPLDFAQSEPSRQEIEKVLSSFVGEISQTPHAYSAVKVAGQRAYKLARQGKTPRLEPRQVTVYRFEVTEYKYPILKVTAEVSSGTYIRSLAEDIGQKLGTGAYLSQLRRTKIGRFDIKDAKDINELKIGLSKHL